MSELGAKLDDLIAVNDYEVFKGYKFGDKRQRADETPRLSSMPILGPTSQG